MSPEKNAPRSWGDNSLDFIREKHIIVHVNSLATAIYGKKTIIPESILIANPIIF
jgi:hypothetical protein